MELFLCQAIVVSVEDKDKLGKIKIRILPEMEGVDNVDLPYAVPFLMDCSTDTLSNSLPQINSTIRVLRDTYWKRFYYLGNSYSYGLFKFDTILNKISNVKNSDNSNIDSTYENIKFNLYEDGGLSIHNNKTGYHGYIHSNGNYVLFDEQGGIVLDIKDKTLLINNGDVNIKNKKFNVDSTSDINLKSKTSINADTLDLQLKGTSGVTIGNGTTTLGNILTELCTDLSTLTTVGSAETQTSPTLTTQMTTLLAKIPLVFK